MSITIKRGEGDEGKKGGEGYEEEEIKPFYDQIISFINYSTNSLNLTELPLLCKAMRNYNILNWSYSDEN